MFLIVHPVLAYKFSHDMKLLTMALSQLLLALRLKLELNHLYL